MEHHVLLLLWEFLLFRYSDVHFFYLLHQTPLRLRVVCHLMAHVVYGFSEILSTVENQLCRARCLVQLFSGLLFVSQGVYSVQDISDSTAWHLTE